MVMEPSQPLSVESFSYSWLLNPNPYPYPYPYPSLDTPNSCSFRVSFDGASFIEMDPNLTPSKRFLVHQDFDFNVPKSPPSITLAHADNLISNGILVPLKPYAPCLDPVSPLPSTTADEGRFRKCRSLSLRKCNKFPRTMVKKYMDFVRPIWCRLKRGRADSSRVQGVENWEYCSSANSGSRTSGACWADNRRRSCDSESSIHEAVVHCKRTIGMN